MPFDKSSKLGQSPVISARLVEEVRLRNLEELTVQRGALVAATGVNCWLYSGEGLGGGRWLTSRPAGSPGMYNTLWGVGGGTYEAEIVIVAYASHTSTLRERTQSGGLYAAPLLGRPTRICYGRSVQMTAKRKKAKHNKCKQV